MSTQAKRVRKVKTPPDPINSNPPDTPPDPVTNDTTIVVREIMPGSIRTQGGRVQRKPYTSIHINDYMNGKLAMATFVTVNAPAAVAIGCLRTILMKTSDLTKKQIQQAKTEEGVTL